MRCKRPRGYLRARAAGGARQRGAVHTRGPAPATVTEVQAVQGRPAEWRTRSVSLRPKCIRPAPIESAGAQRASGRRAAAGSRRTSQRDGGGGDDGEQRRSSQPSKSRCLFTVDAFTDPAGFRLETRVLARTLSLATLSAARHRHNPARHARPRCAHRTSKGSVYERVDGWAGLWVGLLKQEAGHGERGPWRVVKVSEGYWRWFLRSKRWITDAKIFGFAGRSHETQK